MIEKNGIEKETNVEGLKKGKNMKDGKRYVHGGSINKS